MTAERTGHAVVLGGSMAGLLGARVLLNHFARVTLVERDALPGEPAHRRGVPQSKHTHGLLAAGSRTLEGLFPGLTRELVTRGALPCDNARDIQWVFEGKALAQATSGIDGLMLSRPLLEDAVRARVLALPGVVRRDGCQVVDLVSSGSRGRVDGVVLATGETLAADLVVDATGRGSRAVEWLRGLGYDAPLEERVEVGLTYTTRHFRRAAADLDGELGAIVPPTPIGKRGGVMIAQEDGRWTVTLIAHFVPGAPMDLDGFRAFTATLPSPAIHDVVATAAPLGDATTAKFPASVRRRFERLTRVPEGFVVMGDAICSFNPIYGQGMSVAALEAMALDDVLRAGRTAVGRRFFAAAAPIVDTPWTTAVGNDLRMPEAVGPRSAAQRVINAYIARLHRAAHADTALAIAFARVGNLLAPPDTLLAPRIAWRVARGWWRSGQRQPAVTRPDASALGRA